MTLPVGQISLSDVNTELTKAAGAVISLNDAAVRTLAVKPSGIISMNDLRGRTSSFNMNISNQGGGQFDIRQFAVNNGWNQISTLNVTIVADSWSASAGYAPFLITGSFPRGLNFTVSSGIWVTGRGGNGAAGDGTGAPGGPAISVYGTSGPITFYNYGQIAGGGGGGSGGARSDVPWAIAASGKTPASSGTYYYGGGGGGGGASYGAGGAGLASTNGTGAAGAGGTLTTGGAGGAGSNGNPGGNGGSLATASGGAAGAATTGTSGVVTWAVVGTRYGAIG